MRSKSTVLFKGDQPCIFPCSCLAFETFQQVHHHCIAESRSDHDTGLLYKAPSVARAGTLGQRMLIGERRLSILRDRLRGNQYKGKVESFGKDEVLLALHQSDMERVPRD